MFHRIANPLPDESPDMLYELIEARGDRALFRAVCAMNIRPTFVFQMRDVRALSPFELLFAIQRAVRSAKVRTRDESLGTRVHKGKLQIVRVHKHAKGSGCDVTPVSEFLPVLDALLTLERMK